MVTVTIFETYEGDSTGSCFYYSEVLPAVTGLVEQVRRRLANGDTVEYTTTSGRMFQVKLSSGTLINFMLEYEYENPFNWFKSNPS